MDFEREANDGLNKEDRRYKKVQEMAEENKSPQPTKPKVQQVYSRRKKNNEYKRKKEEKIKALKNSYNRKLAES